MALTFLDLTNSVLLKLNEVQVTSSDWPSLRGVHAEAKAAVLQSIRDIQSFVKEWPFNFQTGSQVLTVGQELYDLPEAYSTVDWESFYIEKDDDLSVNSKRLVPKDETYWSRYDRQLDFDSGSDGRNVPDYVFKGSGLKFGVSPSPDKAYTVKFQYHKDPVEMSAYDDTTTIPDRYKNVIIQGALQYFYMIYDNTTQGKVTEDRFKKQLAKMKSDLIEDEIVEVKDSRIIRNQSGVNYGRG